jgi:hypothetical protein
MRHAKATLTVILASAIYLTLAIVSVNYAFASCQVLTGLTTPLVA